MSNGKVMIIDLIVRLIKKYCNIYKMNFKEPHDHSRNKVKVDWNLRNYATNSHLKHAAGVDTSKFAKEAHLASLKS